MLKIATINTWKCERDYEQRLDLLTDRLKEENFDILCCQESFRTVDGEHDTARTLATGLGMSYSFSAARRKKRLFSGEKVESFSGLSILTGPQTCMIYSGSFPLPDTCKAKGSAAQFAIIRKNGDAVLIVNLFLSHLKKKNMRIKQLQTILSHPVMEKQYGAILVCGDINVNPKNEELSFLKKLPEFKLLDGFIKGGGNPRVSALCSNTGIDEEQDGQHIDHIFVLQKRNRPVAKMKFRNSRIILDQSDGKALMPFHHFGVALDLTLSRVRRDSKNQLYRYASFAKPWRKGFSGKIAIAY
ncbi:MAG: hypothetical protein U9R57_04390 [Thermodesulfobacteriota bacterium]|nr:hypothetical protein [Thermodesulfobacteriota bacterium]